MPRISVGSLPVLPNLHVASTMNSPAGAHVPLGMPGRYAVRIHVRGRAEAMERRCGRHHALAEAVDWSC